MKFGAERYGEPAGVFFGEPVDETITSLIDADRDSVHFIRVYEDSLVQLRPG